MFGTTGSSVGALIASAALPACVSYSLPPLVQ